MEVYNYSKAARICWLLAVAWIPVMFGYIVIIDQTASNGWVLVAVGMGLGLGILYLRNLLGSFLIDEKGITSKFPGRNLFFAWEDMEYIGVGEKQSPGPFWSGKGYRFLMYFSKLPPGRVFFRAGRQVHGEDSLRQCNQQFFIIYREGMLEEILKHISEDRIKDVERIKNCRNPHEPQFWTTSKLQDEKIRYLGYDD